MTLVTAAALAGAILIGVGGCHESDELPTPLPASALVAPPADASTDGSLDGSSEAAAPDSAPDGAANDSAQASPTGDAAPDSAPDGTADDSAPSSPTGDAAVEANADDGGDAEGGDGSPNADGATLDANSDSGDP